MLNFRIDFKSAALFFSHGNQRIKNEKEKINTDESKRLKWKQKSREKERDRDKDNERDWRSWGWYLNRVADRISFCLMLVYFWCACVCFFTVLWWVALHKILITFAVPILTE